MNTLLRSDTQYQYKVSQPLANAFKKMNPMLFYTVVVERELLAV